MTESFEPLTNNIYSRRTLRGDFIVMNKYLIKDLLTLFPFYKVKKMID